jgi:hypothetical protein
MFSSLDRIDIALKPTADGRQQYVQTDHRNLAEIEKEPELSVLFALIRVLNPKRMAKAGTPEPVVLYSVQGEAPDFLRRAVRAAGGQIITGSNIHPEPDEGDRPRLDDVISSAFADMARAVATELRVTETPAGLAEAEQALAKVASDPKKNEIAFWSAVIKLGSFGGELIRASNGGQWIIVNSGTLPFALSTSFQGGQATVNPLGKAIKRFTSGEGDSLVDLLDLLRKKP